MIPTLDGYSEIGAHVPRERYIYAHEWSDLVYLICVRHFCLTCSELPSGASGGLKNATFWVINSNNFREVRKNRNCIKKLGVRP